MAKVGTVWSSDNYVYTHSGAVELPLSCAQALDPDNLGLEYWYAACPPNDTRKEYCDKRLKCYDLVLHSLSVFEEQASQSASAQGSNAIDDPEAIRSHAYDLAFSSEDEMFHSTLYDWLINRGLADELLAVRRLSRSTILASLIGLK
jgi:nuclear pore complex protein Nup155